MRWRAWFGVSPTEATTSGAIVFPPLSSLLTAVTVVALPFALRVDQSAAPDPDHPLPLDGPLGMAFAVWWWKPRVSPRYVIMFTVPF